MKIEENYRFKAVIWDQGNVLDSHRESDRAFAEALELSFEDFLKYAGQYVKKAHLGMEELEYINLIRSAAGKQPTTKRFFQEIWQAKRPFDEGMLNVNKQIRAYGLKTAILSNAETVLREMIIDKYTADQHQFDAIVCSCDVGLVKPDPKIYRLCCDRIDVTPTEAIFIDDSQKNVEGFQKLGGYALLHKDNSETVQTLSKLLGIELRLK